MVTYHIVYLGRRIILKFIGRPEYLEISWWATAFEPLLSNFLIVPPIILFIIVSTKMMMDKNMKWSLVFLIHFILSFVYSAAITANGYLYRGIFYNTDLSAITTKEFFVFTLFGSNLNYLGYVGFVTITYAYYYIEKISNTEIQKAQLAKQIQDIRLQFLKSQLNPHFLFNTLNTISSLIQENPSKAEQMIGDLGDLLREVLLVKDENLIEVCREVIILNKYLNIMQTRFSDHLSITSKVEKKVEHSLLPSMLLQPLLENSFKHGYSYEVTNLNVDLSIYEESDQLVIDVSNNGAPLSNMVDTVGLGIRNIKERLETLYQGNFSFSFSNIEDGKGVCTTIKIPLIFE